MGTKLSVIAIIFDIVKHEMFLLVRLRSHKTTLSLGSGFGNGMTDA